MSLVVMFFALLSSSLIALVLRKVERVCFISPRDLLHAGGWNKLLDTLDLPGIS